MSNFDALSLNTRNAGTVEDRITMPGYGEALDDRLDRAYVILEIATRLFPHSANTWDSLAEITLYRGDRDKAIALCEKALAVDPGFTNAGQQLEKIRAQ